MRAASVQSCTCPPTRPHSEVERTWHAHLCTSWRFSCLSRLCCSPLAAVSFSSSDTRFSRKTTSGARQWLENQRGKSLHPQANNLGGSAHSAGGGSISFMETVP